MSTPGSVEQTHELHPAVAQLARALAFDASAPSYPQPALDHCVEEAARPGVDSEAVVVALFALAVRGVRVLGAEGRLAVGQLLETAARVARRARAAGTLSDDRLSRLGVEHLRVLGEQKRSVVAAPALRAPVRGVGLRRLA